MFTRPTALFAVTALVQLSVQAIPLETPSTPISWGPCNSTLKPDLLELAAAGAYECAVLSVPLDYTDEQSSRQIDLPLVKWAAAIESKGSVLVNPGGPGGSGIELVVAAGSSLLSPIHDDWDVIGFDPRGTGLTLPFDCGLQSTNSNPNQRRSAELYALDLTEPTLLEEAFASASTVADACYQTQNETARFISTAFAARDMLSIVDALDEDDLLRYWGMSYGTFLGTTFASMFPERVGRMLLDSNVDPDEYIDGSWLNARADAPKSLNNLFDECVATPDLCPFVTHFGPDITTSTLNTYLNDLFTTLSNDTTPLIGSRYMNAKTNIISLLYYPNSFSLLAEILSQAFQRNYTLLEITPQTSPHSAPQAYHATACTDSTFRAESAADLFAVTKRHLTNPNLNGSGFEDAGIISAPFWQCPNWPVEPVERFTGPWGEQKTRNPILFANSLFDSGTPMMTAERLHGLFDGSGLLRHRGVGHGVMNHPSNCTSDAIKAYFLDGTLPDEEAICEQNLPPFEYDALVKAQAAQEAEETALSRVRARMF